MYILKGERGSFRNFRGYWYQFSNSKTCNSLFFDKDNSLALLLHLSAGHI